MSPVLSLVGVSISCCELVRVGRRFGALYRPPSPAITETKTPEANSHGGSSKFEILSAWWVMSYSTNPASIGVPRHSSYVSPVPSLVRHNVARLPERLERQRSEPRNIG